MRSFAAVWQPVAVSANILWATCVQVSAQVVGSFGGLYTSPAAGANGWVQVEQLHTICTRVLPVGFPQYFMKSLSVNYGLCTVYTGPIKTTTTYINK